MANRNNTQQLVTLLQRTVEARVLAGLQEVVHEAVATGGQQAAGRCIGRPAPVKAPRRRWPLCGGVGQA